MSRIQIWQLKSLISTKETYRNPNNNLTALRSFFPSWLKIKSSESFSGHLKKVNQSLAPELQLPASNAPHPKQPCNLLNFKNSTRSTSVWSWFKGGKEFLKVSTGAWKKKKKRLSLKPTFFSNYSLKYVQKARCCHHSSSFSSSSSHILLLCMPLSPLTHLLPAPSHTNTWYTNWHRHWHHLIPTKVCSRQ